MRELSRLAALTAAALLCVVASADAQQAKAKKHGLSKRAPIVYMRAPEPVTTPKAEAPKADDRRAAQRSKYVWNGLAQPQIDALTKELKGQKLSVIIFCTDQSLCGDLALDFDNAFESAGLTSQVVKPFMDDTQGLSTTSKVLADAIGKATGMRPAIYTAEEPKSPCPAIVGRDEAGQPTITPQEHCEEEKAAARMVPAVRLAIGAKK